MSPALPPLDMHAHVAPSASVRQLEQLGAVVFAATRSLDEFSKVLTRTDAVTVWGVGCHPGVPAAINGFSAEQFQELIGHTAFVSEIGLERRSKTPMDAQQSVLGSMLAALVGVPRIASVHSSGAVDAVLDLIATHPANGVVLHWWRGTAAQTKRAVELGCWFSINAAGLGYPDDIAHVPLDRLLTETDHPSGDRSSPSPRQPGAMADVEAGLAKIYGLPGATELRAEVWANFARLVDATDVARLLPTPVQRMVDAARKGER
ncbi:TatD family hydrolase [Agromyces endophyticus]|uniref:TatD family hydrolase n=1 Tax=Agromyces sp. H17E-10 TaxID=2932244 RepID=UPI001FD3AA94|nr:TatD family hydrolase [Agromyces sp. H17E-10]UOQ89474.1 TatD family hydrolase [Agromyces sp. H17E-10]